MKFLFYLICLSSFSSVVLSIAKKMPLESVFYIGELEKIDFDNMFPGEVLQNLEIELKGQQYLVYEHKSLSYYFGPSESKEILEQYKAVLDPIVEQVKQKRASLSDARTYIIEVEHSKEESPTHNPMPKATPALIKPWWQSVLDILGFY
jgi:hypothetical protein